MSLNPSTTAPAGNVVVVDVVVHQTPAKILDAFGATVDTVKESYGIFVMTAVYGGQGWVADSIKVAQ